MSEQPNLNPESSAVQKHLEIMQGVIQRMAENSRSCKLWCVTLVAATLVLVARTGEPQHALIALAPAVLFWILDSYYLSLERGFRDSYNAFVKKLHNSDLPTADLYRISPGNKPTQRFLWALFQSFSTYPFYLVIAGTILLTWQFVI